MGTRPKLGLCALVVAGALLLGACGGGTSVKSGGAASSSGSTATGTSITISNFMFEPMALTTSPGATVRVTNKDSVTHTLTATGGQFNTGDITHDETKSFRAPEKAGTYHYICSIHQYMMGTVIVK